MIGNWTLSQDNYTCIKMSAQLTLLIDYELDNGTNSTVQLMVPAENTEVDGTCNYNVSSGMVEKDEQIMILIFFDNWQLQFKFTNNTQLADKNNVDVYQVSLTYILDKERFPHAQSQGAKIHIENVGNKTGALHLFSTMNDRSYKCRSLTNTTIAANNFTLLAESVQVEAFMTTTEFLRPQVCNADLQDGKSDLIPIIIGAALAALVVVVLVGYLIGRARTKRTIYETI
jgi:lysosomal-associated membrane protein 1/2